MYGFKLTLPVNWEKLDENMDIEEDIKERIDLIKFDLPEIRRLGSLNNIKSKIINEKRYIEKVIESEFEVGDKVLKYVPGIKTKFEPLWEGPYTVTRVAGKGTYIISDQEMNREIVIGDYLKTYFNNKNMIPVVASSRLNSKIRKHQRPIGLTGDGQVFSRGSVV
ncbi:hypothetical protein AYI69_g5164 [Smittium culicis]|uniref:Retrovirus-related Pol polyprotein from transposon n=1 Tax=Smittium culicis TaxID=133412 RepID=A0A1R1Y7Y0_9FUNG|nr:hypothetical protein AYI69_g5164 [Smittium culicis]